MKDKTAIIPINIEVIEKRYRHFIMRNIRGWLKSLDEEAWNEAYSRVMRDVAGKKEIPVKHGEAGVKSFLVHLAKWRSWDVGRIYRKRKIKRDQVAQQKLEGKIIKDYGAQRMTTFELKDSSRYGKEKERFKLRNASGVLLDEAQERMIKVVNMDIFEDYCSGMARKEVAKKYGLTDLQVKWRLRYTRQRLKEGLAKAKRREKLRQGL